eukprot:1579173-Pleurochrysis_carterae.AAC.1
MAECDSYASRILAFEFQTMTIISKNCPFLSSTGLYPYNIRFPYSAAPDSAPYIHMDMLLARCWQV